MPGRLFFTDSDEANALIATDAMALLIGFALDQQVKVQKAFSGPLAKRFDIAIAAPLAPPHPTLGDVDSQQALADYQAAKRTHKAEWAKLRAGRPDGGSRQRRRLADES